MIAFMFLLDVYSLSSIAGKGTICLNYRVGSQIGLSAAIKHTNHCSLSGVKGDLRQFSAFDAARQYWEGFFFFFFPNMWNSEKPLGGAERQGGHGHQVCLCWQRESALTLERDDSEVSLSGWGAQPRVHPKHLYQTVALRLGFHKIFTLISAWFVFLYYLHVS